MKLKNIRSRSKALKEERNCKKKKNSETVIRSKLKSVRPALVSLDR